MKFPRATRLRPIQRSQSMVRGRRTGRVATMPTAVRWLADTIHAARDAVSPEAVCRAAARARDVPVAQRASRVIELARQADGTAAGR